jgi:hypothetical protein
MRRLGEVMNEHPGPTLIRSYCCYLWAYLATSTISREHVHELVELSRQKQPDGLAKMYETDFDEAAQFDFLRTWGEQDALEGKPPAPAPDGFPLEVLELT